MVGLPARGKSFVSRKMQLYLQWSGVNCRIFNVGKYRREAHALYVQEQTLTSDEMSDRKKKGLCDADFFDPANKEAKAVREKAADLALRDMLRWLDEDDYSDSEDDSNPDFSRHSSVSLSLASGVAKLTFSRHQRIAIFDATNSTRLRRKWILEECTSPIKRPGNPVGIVFVESLCDDQELLEENYRYKVSSSPDFQGLTTEEALVDLRSRVGKYESQYEPITEDNLSYIKIFNLSSKLMVNHIYGRMAKELVPALMAWHIGTRPVYLCRPGQTVSGIETDGEDYVNHGKLATLDPDLMESIANGNRRRKSVLRGDKLGPNGLRFRNDLLHFFSSECRQFATKRASVRDMAHTGTSISGLCPAPNIIFGSSKSFDEVREIDPSDDVDGLPNCNSQEQFALHVVTSTMRRAADTVSWEDAPFPIDQMSNLNPLDKGDYAGKEISKLVSLHSIINSHITIKLLTGIENVEEIKALNPSWYEKFDNDPFNTRFPGGESYRDLTVRLKSVLIDVEQQVVPTLMVSHVSILQCLMAYFRNSEVENCMSIDVPMHTVIKFTPVRGGGWSETQHPLY